MAGVGQVRGGASGAVEDPQRAAEEGDQRRALPVGILGISEPLIFRVTIATGAAVYRPCLGRAVGGALISYWKVATVITFGIFWAAGVDHRLR